MSKLNLYEVAKAGRSLLNIRYPKEFELYMCALELLDQNNKTLQYFIFPVMPSNIEESQPEITNIKKTLGGVTVLSNSTFIPRDITLTGNFGRSFKVLLGKNVVDLVSAFKERRQEEYNVSIKTGYGCCKILESIKDDAKSLTGGVKRLIFYNLALGNNYLVKPLNLKFAMSQESNMIWNYSLSLKAIAPLDDLQESTLRERQGVVLTKTVQDSATRVTNKLISMVL